MNLIAEALKQRTKQFALDIIGLVRILPKTEEARIMGRQLLRSGPGVGSNYRAACRARSRREFAARVAIALEESDESGFWLEIIGESKISTAARVGVLLDEANQLSAIFAQSVMTARAPRRS